MHSVFVIFAFSYFHEDINSAPNTNKQSLQGFHLNLPSTKNRQWKKSQCIQ